MITPLIGFFSLCGVVYVALMERGASELSFFDIHAAIVVFGGVFGAVLVATESKAVWRMVISFRSIFPSTDSFTKKMKLIDQGTKDIREAWRQGQRSKILKMADEGHTVELRVAADILIRKPPPSAIVENFTELKARLTRTWYPVIEAWEMVSKLAPSFGMVGTVTGMIQLFRTMGSDISSLGGAMAMALLATLYGISMGAALGGPMVSRVNNQLNDRLDLIEILQHTILALVEEDTSHEKS